MGILHDVQKLRTCQSIMLSEIFYIDQEIYKMKNAMLAEFYTTEAKLDSEINSNDNYLKARSNIDRKFNLLIQIEKNEIKRNKMQAEKNAAVAQLNHDTLKSNPDYIQICKKSDEVVQRIKDLTTTINIINSGIDKRNKLINEKTAKLSYKVANFFDRHPYIKMATLIICTAGLALFWYAYQGLKSLYQSCKTQSTPPKAAQHDITKASQSAAATFKSLNISQVNYSPINPNMPSAINYSNPIATPTIISQPTTERNPHEPRPFAH